MIESASYYEQRSGGLGDRFLKAIEATEDLIRRFPGIGSPLGGDIRILRVKKFPFGIVYKEYSDHLFVFSVAHFSRPPGFWKNRLSQENRVEEED